MLYTELEDGIDRSERGSRSFRKGAMPLNRDMNVSRTSWHKEVILGRNSVFRVFRLYLRLSDLMLQ